MAKVTKKWYESKTVWFNAIMTVILTAKLFNTETTALIAGVGNVILRVWFTDKKIEK